MRLRQEANKLSNVLELIFYFSFVSVMKYIYKKRLPKVFEYVMTNLIVVRRININQATM